MSEGLADEFGRLRPSQFQRIDAVCDRFETELEVRPLAAD